MSSDIVTFDLGDFFDVFGMDMDEYIDPSWFLEEISEQQPNFTQNIEDVDTGHAEPLSKRFKATDDAELEKIVLESRSKSTLKTTVWGVKIFKQWLQLQNQNTDFEMLPPDALNELLKRFYAEVRNTEGQYYSKSSFVGIRASLHRHIRLPPFQRNINIIQDKEFHTANNIFSGMLKRIKQLGLDNPTHHEPISQGDLQKIRNHQSIDNPSELQKKVWFDLTLGFGRRGCENQRQLTNTSFVVDTDDVGCEFITMTHSEASKNHPGGIGDHDHGRPRIYATGTASCPVLSFRKYVSKLNPCNTAFFQQPRKNTCESDASWYTSKALGHNTLEQLMKVISHDCGLSRIYTNHCVRATTVTLLSHAGIEAREITKITGHKNEQSLSSYNRDSSTAQKRQYSAILQGSQLQNVVAGQSTHTITTSSLAQSMSGLFKIDNSQVVINNYFRN